MSMTAVDPPSGVKLCVAVVLAGSSDIVISSPPMEPSEAERLLSEIGSAQLRVMERPDEPRHLQQWWLAIPNMSLVRAAFLTNA